MARLPKLAIVENNGYRYYQTQAQGGMRWRFDQYTLEEATACFNAFLAAHSVRAPPAPAKAPAAPAIKQLGSISFFELSEAYKVYARATKAAGTVRNREVHIDRFTAWSGDPTAESITIEHLNGFLDFVVDAFEVSEQTKHNHAETLKAVFSWGVSSKGKRDGKPLLPVGFNPFEPYEAPKKKVRTMMGDDEMLSDAEITAMLAYLDKCEDKAFAAAIKFMLWTGARVSEPLTAKVSDIDHKNKIIVLREWKNANSVGRDRHIPISPQLYKVLAKQINGKGPNDLIFDDLNRRGCRTGWKKMAKAIKLRPHLNRKSLRHNFISAGINKGLSFDLVGEMCGTSAKQIKATYGHYNRKVVGEALAKITAGLGG